MDIADLHPRDGGRLFRTSSEAPPAPFPGASQPPFRKEAIENARV
jgi:hypothetical protein